MSRSSSQQQKQGNLNYLKELPFAIKKASDSTMEMAELMKQNFNQTENVEENNQQYDEEEYGKLSSGVYQVQEKEEEDEPEEREKEQRREYHSQQVVLEKGKDQNQSKQSIKSQEQREGQQVQEERYEEIVQSEENIEGAQVPELQFQKPQDTQYSYPSMMQESTTSNTEPIFTKKESEYIEEQKNQICKEKVNQSNNFASIVKDVVYPTVARQKQVVDQPLIDLQEREVEKKESEVVQKEHKIPIPRFYKPRKYEQIPMEKSQTKKKATNIDQLPQKPVLKIVGYQKQYFLRIQTQVYQIEYVSKHRNYIFCRKFADFVGLHKMIKHQFPGFILYPFPDNSLQFFKKIKLSVGSQKQKIIIIEHRLLQLQKYLNFLLEHRELSTSQLFQVFICDSKQLFTKQFSSLEVVLDHQEEQFLASSLKQNYNNIKNMVKSGMSYFSSYVSSSASDLQSSALHLEATRKAQHLLKNYTDIRLQIQKDILICSNFQAKVDKLIQIYSFSKNFKPIDSSIDSVLKLSTKMAASRAYFDNYQTWLQDQLLSRILYYTQLFNQVKEAIQYRTSLLERVQKLSVQELDLVTRLIDRVEQFDSRFQGDWSVLRLRFDSQYDQMIESFNKQWHSHCELMSKIWK